jgi:hypothetical protein
MHRARRGLAGGGGLVFDLCSRQHGQRCPLARLPVSRLHSAHLTTRFALPVSLASCAAHTPARRCRPRPMKLRRSPVTLSACAPTCNNTSWPMKIGSSSIMGGSPHRSPPRYHRSGHGPEVLTRPERAFKSPGPLPPGLGRRWLLGACRPPSHGHRRHWQCARI